MRKKNPEVISAISATYRKASKKIAAAAGVRFKHTRFPSQDLEDLADVVADQSKDSQERALRYYKRALRRGFIEACDAVLDGRVKVKDGELVMKNRKVVITRRFKFANGSREERVFKFTPEDLEFN